MIIRKAELNDAEKMAECLLLAMEEIVFEFIGENNSPKALEFMNWCVKTENTQYSYQNAWVAVLDNEVIGAVVMYDGKELHRLRSSVKGYLKNITTKPFVPEDETGPGEMYIDSFGVSEKHQGKGVGSKMLEHLIQEFHVKQGLTLGLLVEKNNPAAKRLYQRLGFKKAGEKELVGKQMDHMQISSN